MDCLKPLEAEQAVAGILVSGTCWDAAAVRALTPAEFFDPNARHIFAASKALLSAGQRPDAVSLDARLTQDFGAEEAQRLILEVLPVFQQFRLLSAQLPEYVRLVQEGARRRELARIADALSRGAADERRDVAELIDSARNCLRNSARCRGGATNATDAIITAYEAFEKNERPIPTGIQELDQVLEGGLHRGELTVIGARPAVGKSAGLLQMCISAAQAGKSAVLVSLEMSAEQIGARLMGRFAEVNVGRLRTGEPPSDQLWADLAEASVEAEQALGSRLSILARGGMTIEELTGEVITLHDGGACDVLFVDYLQLLRTKQKTGNDFERLGIVSRGLKAITLDLGIPVVAAAQVRRQNNGGILRAPGLDELRGSGDIEQDADNVVLMHRPESLEDSTLNTPGYLKRHHGLWERAQSRGLTLMSFDVAKQRQGMTARAWTVFDPAHMRFYDPLEVT